MNEEDFCLKLGAILKATRTMRSDKMSQYTLAELAGLTRRYIQMIEGGKQNITLTALFSIAEALELPPARLVEQLDQALKTGHLPESILENLPPKKIGRPKKSKIE